MSSSTREIVASCFSFIKVYCSSLPNPMVAASIGDIVSYYCILYYLLQADMLVHINITNYFVDESIV